MPSFLASRVFFNDYNLRLDQQFSTSFKLYGSYTQNDFSGLGRPIRIKEDRTVFDAAQGNYSPSKLLNSSVGYTWVVSPSVVNDSRMGYFRRSSPTEVPSFGQDWPGQLGIPNVDSALMPAFGSQNGVYNLHGATPSKNVNKTVSFRNDTTWVKNSHAFKFGYEILRFRLNSGQLCPFLGLRF